VPLPVHRAYVLPASLPVMALEENLAEKIARLTRRTPARDVYDLVWISTNAGFTFAPELVRRVAVLKTWVDQFGLDSPPTSWQAVSGAVDYQTTLWATVRAASEYDEQSIGVLAVPAPSLESLSAGLTEHYGFLARPDELEQKIITGAAGARSLVLSALAGLPGARLADRHLF